MSENSTCAICARSIIWLALRDGTKVACNPTKVLLSSLPLDSKTGPNFTTLITVEGVAVKKEFEYPGTDIEGYLPHFYTCDTSPDKAPYAVLVLDRLWLGNPSVGPADPGEGGQGDGGELE